MKKIIFSLFLICSSCLASFAGDLPLVGITPHFDEQKIQLNYDYASAIIENGGVPLVLAPTSDEKIIQTYVEKIDAVVFSGGMDIPPSLYEQKQHPTTKIMDPTRSEFEKKFIKAFIASGKPALGICLGMQFTNVLHGGTMYQDIPSMIGDKVRHRNGEMYTNFHSVGIARGSLLANILGATSVRVISRHHQAVDKVAGLFTIAARSSDGVIEALERTDGKFGVFVQWHPESMRMADPEHRNRLFRALIEAAR